MAPIAGTAVLALVAGLLIVTHQSGGSSSPAVKEVALQTPADAGDAPFTESVATETGPAESTAASAGGQVSPSGATAIRSVQGSATGLYGGEMKKPACDVEKLITQTASGDKGKAWAAAEGIEQSAIPGYLRSLTSVVLRADTRVTNHNYRNGSANGYQAVLQAGTAVLVDSQGVPRVRCACGNPLTPPVLASGGVTYTGKAWSSFQPSSLIVVTPAPAPVTQIVLVNVSTGTWFARETGHPTTADKPVPAPKEPLAPGVPGTSPTASASASSSTSSSASSHPATGTPSTGSPSSASSSATSSTSSHPATGTPSTGSPSSASSSATSSASKSSPPATLSPSASEASTATTTATAPASSANPATATGSAGGTASATSTSTSEQDSEPASPPPALLPASVNA
ncbi:hypothetical protein GCM10010495_58310 [Kitasatospora herbaricolor]|uniref:DUF6777 domain-containing protein n=1 Tax=Kitasatospora herbaricolor TaxID=68217 RepID=UPI001747E09C|nr:DUF6777 domain-containing protein [Kitasatospora herbaricolor]MDQ0306587.1 hypothetical protein [Kitasatospora herbaricolor]GGV33767.1 hypothetical protein GCM10010495_58310 [Kitasatospora herbaricolor]